MVIALAALRGLAAVDLEVAGRDGVGVDHRPQGSKGEPAMWQHNYVIHSMRMAELLAAAERERRWRRQDEANGRRIPSRDPGRARAVAARLAAATSRLAARAAHRLDGRVPVDVGHERLLRDA